MRNWTSLAGIGPLLAVACGGDEGTNEAGTDPGTDPGAPACADPDAPTWYQDVAPIVAGNCQSCHVAGGIAPFPLQAYEDAALWAPDMATETKSKRMPPFLAEETDECDPRFDWKDDLRLSDDEIATISAWAAGGACEGDPDAPADLPDPVDLSLGDYDVELLPVTPYTPEGASDDYACFVLDPQIDTDHWVTAVGVEPGNLAVVHHVLVFTDTERTSEGYAGEDGVYDCFGDVGVDDGLLLGGWVPGSLPGEYPENTGVPIEAGSLIVMQIHYFPGGEEADPDSTAVRLRWTEEEPDRTAVLALVGNAGSADDGLLPGPDDEGDPEFRIPAGTTDHTETIEYTLDEGDGPYTLFAMGTHMHMVGTDMLIEVDHPTPRGDEPPTECLIQTPRWDFGWQRIYGYDAELDDLPKIWSGDTLRLRCTYDNTLDNPHVAEALDLAGESEPGDVYLGEGTLDEMCLGVFGVVLPQGTGF